MVRHIDEQHARVTRQLLGVLGEEEYFSRQEAARLLKSVEDLKAKLLLEEREQARALHFMKCPKCGMQLDEISFGDVRIDKCFSCENLWLDKGELDTIRHKDGAV